MTPDDELVETTRSILEGAAQILFVERQADEEAFGGSYWRFLPQEGEPNPDEVVDASFAAITKLDPTVLHLDETLPNGGFARRDGTTDEWRIAAS